MGNLCLELSVGREIGSDPFFLIIEKLGHAIAGIWLDQLNDELAEPAP